MRSTRHYLPLGLLLAGMLTACQSPTGPDEDPTLGISTTPRPPRPPTGPDLLVQGR